MDCPPKKWPLRGEVADCIQVFFRERCVSYILDEKSIRKFEDEHLIIMQQYTYLLLKIWNR